MTYLLIGISVVLLFAVLFCVAHINELRNNVEWFVDNADEALLLRYMGLDK